MSAQSNCPVCSGKAKVDYRLARLGSVALRCQLCRFTWIEPPLRSNDTEYENYYTNPFYASQILSDDSKFRRHIADIDKIHPLHAKNGERVLEIGSSYGLMLRLLRERGYHAEGIELLGSGVQASRDAGFTIHQLPFEKFEATSAFDLVLSTHVVEHLRDIKSYFACTSSWLKPGGTHIFLTPNADAFFFRLLRQFWAGATPDEHNLFLGSRSVACLAKQNGLEVVAIKTTGRYWSLGRGILAEFWHRYRDRRAGQNKSASINSTSAPSGRRKRDCLFRIISKIEWPFLTLAHKALAPFVRSDELLVVLRKPPTA
jgi:2-polyprenyl-3-methyl-5-hydroxy-6-metoxy-1,4-benzoquinol methylase